MHQSVVRRFAEEKKGTVAIVFALTAIAVVGILGLAIDLGRAMSTRAQLQAAADSAALAGARLASTALDSERTTAAQKVFTANVSNNPDLASVTPQIVVSSGVVNVSADAQLGVTIAGIFGVSSVDVAVTGSAVQQTLTGGMNLEVSMMIDLTGSMGDYRNGTRKIDGLKSAASSLLNILFPNGASSSPYVKVGIAPFADYVNAGPYAAAATGLTSTGAYANLTNLASTKQGPYTGSYSGVISNAAGSQAGATPLTTTTSGQTSAAGATYSNSYCANPTTTTTAAGLTNNGVAIGVWIPNYVYNNYYQWTGTAPAGVIKSSSGAPVEEIYSYSSTKGYAYYSPQGNQYSYTSIGQWTSDYYVPLVTNGAGLTVQTRTASYNNSQKTGPIGVALPGNSNTPPAPFVSSSSNGYNGYWQLYGIDYTGAPMYQWATGYYAPVYTALNVTSTLPACTSSVSQPSGALISCVTERTGTNAYTDVSPSTSAVGSYAHGNSNVQNYSSDGKCYVAGRELPAVIPLTNQKSTLTNFFTNATIGGGTPGHIGTAWAWYLLSPNWSSVWPGNSTPVSYDTQSVKKIAILMTDGEYNEQYSSVASRTQALALCSAMKTAGITVYTIGFGYSTTAKPGDGSTDGQAMDLLKTCSSGSNFYYFPYDQAALQSTFTAIGNSLNQVMTTTITKVTN